MSNYLQDISELTYSLITATKGSVLFRDDGIIALNPKNAEHYQSNLCFRIRLSDVKNLGELVSDTNNVFSKLCCKPRFHLDELSKPSLDSICSEFKNLGFKNIAVDNNSAMFWSKEESLNNEKSIITQQDEYCCRLATADDVENIADIIAAAFGYDCKNYDWLKYNVKEQIDMPDTFQVFVVTIPSDEGNVIASTVALLAPPGLPHLGYICGVATHPDHQRKGLAYKCLKYALEIACKPSQKIYLETFDQDHHAYRMYERVGFKFVGYFKSTVIAFDAD